jgi:tetratricopeptide (TPR) repeat protein
VLVVNLSSVHRLPEASLEAFKAGTFAEYNGDTKKAEEEYQKAVDEDPSYSEAWLSLGGVQSSDQTDVKQLRKSVESYRKAIDLGQDGYVVHNNLGYTSLLLGDRKTAETEINIAHELRQEEPFILMSEAELALVKGDVEKANEWRSEAVAVLTKFDIVFRNQFFAALRLQDRSALKLAGVPQERLDTFYNELRDIEASIDALHSKQPLALDGASLSDLTATYKQDRQAYEIVFSQNNLHVGDVTSIRVYNATTEAYSQYSSTPRIDVATEAGNFTFTAHTPIDAGKQRIELYLNGHFQTSVEVDSPGDDGGTQ